jgi:ADP-ribose pyrophosphatase YjhB (NUDIX family)
MIKCEFENNNKASLRHVTADVLLIKDNKILLALRAKSLVEGGKWAILGGYADRDETLIECAEREVMEESGWKVENLQLLRVLDAPDRRNDDRQNITFVYVATPTQKTGEPDWESTQLKWFGLDELPPAEEMAFEHLEDIKFYLTRVE